MKWAEAKTRLSFVTATLNSLWVGTPPSFQQQRVDGRARQVRGGAGVEGVGLVPELAVERSGSIPSRGGPYAPGVDHAARAALHRDRRIGAELAGDMSIGRSGERSEEHTSELQSQSNLVCRLLLEK